MAKGIIKDLVIVGVGILVIVIGLQIAFGGNPFYVVASGSMIPALQVYDVLIVQGHEPFEDIEIGDIIVFDRPSDHNRVIVHRVASIIDDDPKTLRTKGDANPASIPGTDFPITEEEYIGKVAYVIPQIGYVTQVLKPPTNYIIIAIVIGIMIAKQMVKKKKEKDLTFEDPFESKGKSNESSFDDKTLGKLKKIDKDSKKKDESDSDDSKGKTREGKIDSQDKDSKKDKK